MPLPAPQTWTDGEEATNIPSADALNLDWRDSFDFLLGYTKPLIYLMSTTVQALGTNTSVTINWQSELVKRGGMVHSVNGSGITVPYTGQYSGFYMGGFRPISTVSTRLVCQLVKNGGPILPARVDMSPSITGDWEVHGSFTADLAANDVMTMTMRTVSGTASTSNLGLDCPRIAMWYSGDYV